MYRVSKYVRTDIHEKDMQLVLQEVRNIGQDMKGEIDAIRTTIKEGQAASQSARDYRRTWILGLVCASLPGLISTGGVITLLIGGGHAK